jgi:hypothetical protein
MIQPVNELWPFRVVSANSESTIQRLCEWSPAAGLLHQPYAPAVMRRRSPGCSLAKVLRPHDRVHGRDHKLD